MSIYTSSSRRSSEGSLRNIMLLLALVVPVAIWNGFVLKTLWNWFVPSIFHTAPHLNLAHAIGLSLVVSCFKSIRIDEDNKQEDAWALLLVTLVYGTLLLIMGLIVHSFI